MKVTLILTCAGKGARAGFGKNKLLVDMDGKTCLERTFEIFTQSGLIDNYIITASKEDYHALSAIIGKRAEIVTGGDSRTQSVKNALDKVKDGIVLIHDGARPFVTKKIISDCIESVKNYGSAVTALPTRDTLLRAENGTVSDYLGKEGIYSVQTPQGFFAEDIKSAYAKTGNKVFPDDGSVYAEYVGMPHIVEGSPSNIKLTYKEDFEILQPSPVCRFGTGFDCHKLVCERPLILGGITIPHDKGLLGHSDADVLTHAIMDAILSAAAMRDIGYHFSDKDPAYKDISSMILFSRVLDMIKEKGFSLSSVSATIMAEKPKLSPFIPQITANLAKAASLPQENIGIAATTTEGLGFTGREEGICVHATAVLIKNIT